MIVRMVLLLLVFCQVATAASCSLEIPDALGDTEPMGMPSYYDLTAVNQTLDNDTFTWAWRAEGMANSLGIQYWGGMGLAALETEVEERFASDEGPPHFHPACERYADPDGIPTTECRLTRSTTLAGGAVTFEMIQFLNWTVDGEWLKVSFPTSAIGLEPGLRINTAYAYAEISATFDARVAGSSTSPIIVDRVDNWTWDLCWPEESESVPLEETPTIAPKEAPTLPVLWLFVVSALAAAWRRNR